VTCSKYLMAKLQIQTLDFRMRRKPPCSIYEDDDDKKRTKPLRTHDEKNDKVADNVSEILGYSKIQLEPGTNS